MGYALMPMRCPQNHIGLVQLILTPTSLDASYNRARGQNKGATRKEKNVSFKLFLLADYVCLIQMIGLLLLGTQLTKK